MKRLLALFKIALGAILVGMLGYALVAGSALLLYREPSLQLGESITFSKPSGDQPIPYLKSGWAYPEAWGVWTLGKKASLALPLPNNAKTLVITGRALVSKERPSQIVDIYFGDTLAKSVILNQTDGNRMTIDLTKAVGVTDANGVKQLLITFVLPKAVKPKDIGIGDDERELAFGLHSLEFH